MVTSPVRIQGWNSAKFSSENQPINSPNVRLPWQPLTLPTTQLFGTDGIRGRAGTLLSEDLALQVGFWAGLVLQEYSAVPGPVILGQDSRNSSDMLATALAKGLTTAGLEVWHLGLCPTPGVAYLCSATSAIGGVMISASHNR
ncbi:MAG: phosphoglucosamine mutase, partial [Moorea sp. SIO3H5]|nr:phosphoglucosamine mutase [Moorena sp. SIO3H5]